MTKAILLAKLTLICTTIVFLGNFDQKARAVDSVGQWMRHVVEFKNDSYEGNPFELDFFVEFFQPESGRKMRLPGYFAGGNTWKVGFMPDALGTWEYITISKDPDLNQKKGRLTCIPSDLPGMLKADSVNSKKWKYSDGDYVIPMAFRMEFFYEPASIEEFETAARFLKDDVKGHMFETRLLDGNTWFDGRTDYIFAGNWQNHRFDLSIWDRMERRMKILTQYGLGAHIMFYSDDQGKPDWKGRSRTEALVIRYVVARLIGYPVVWFNTGIDIAEYRSRKDVDWFGEQIRSLDPYGHPISSRHGGGSGNIVMSGQTFDSQGQNKAQIHGMTKAYLRAGVPVSMDDAWGENRGSHEYKDHTEHDIRRAFWKCVVAGGLGGLVRGGGDGLHGTGHFSIHYFADDLESEQWLRLINTYVRQKLGRTFGGMEPAPELVSNAYCLADPGGEEFLYFTPGKYDRYDPNTGGPFTLKLPSMNRQYMAIWFDPRSGNEITLGLLSGGKNHTVSPSSADDWVLHVKKISDSEKTN